MDAPPPALDAPPFPAWRVAALLSVLGNVAYNAFGSDSPPRNEDPIGIFRVLASGPRFVPVWGLVHAAFLTFCVVSLMPSRREVRAFDRLAVPVVGMNVLAAMALAAFRSHELPLSFALLGAVSVLAVDAFLSAHDAIARRELGFYASAPFSLTLGLIMVAAFTHGSALLLSPDVQPFGIEGERVAMVMVGVAAVVAALLAARFDDFVLPGVVGWATLAVVLARRLDAPDVARVALFSMAACLVAGIGAALERLSVRTALASIDPEPLRVRRSRTLRSDVKPAYSPVAPAHGSRA